VVDTPALSTTTQIPLVHEIAVVWATDLPRIAAGPLQLPETGAAAV
jgi:hypothetical protein